MKIYKTFYLKKHAQNKEYFYHATFYKNLPSIAGYGLMSNFGRNIGGPSYDSHRNNRVFASKTISGIKRWVEKLQNIADLEYDDFFEAGAIPVILRFSYGEQYSPDEVAIQERIDEDAIYFDSDGDQTSVGVGEDIEVWDGSSWIDISNYESIDLSDAVYKMDEEDDYYYLNEKSSLFNPV